MKPETKDAAVAHALAALPRESCGLVVVGRKGLERFAPCRNEHPGTDGFVLNPNDWAAAADTGDIVGIVHSHPYGSPEPSQIDRVSCERVGLPWHIVVVPEVSWTTLEPTGYRAPLIGREFTHGVLDCYSLVRDAFAEKKGIDIPDFPRLDEWWHRGENLYLDNFEQAGFVVVSRNADGFVMQPFDCPLMQLGSPVVNHAAVHLGDNIILHHIIRRLSCREVYGGFWRHITTHIVRHRSLM
ncbi:COG1310 Predicted metal-dependent protease of the PAD1/JAB1 superfamily [uncultured Caudovirales phage]|uniref:COG1310 Predicted metal-dependent protease of the PAD1/JAB1 superfamily n=1 Tax=uncultured Caudovirales phage TaxID=2100421 RepID=A0A6J5QAH7_9CAUD|nr:COG1310 Predicted metal-dependent protease of the PAD1/JAB1 superfamily [uncultured Caudovirales phage]